MTGSIGKTSGLQYPLTFTDWVTRREAITARKQGVTQVQRNAARRQRDQIMRDLGMSRNRDGSWE